jgi:hypothetical protein
MSDYTPTEARNLYSDYANSQADAPRTARTKEDGTQGGLPCLSAHISPHVEYRAGARLLKAHRGGAKDSQVGGGERGEIKGFSDNSRRRLLRTIESIRTDADLPLFITLTYPNSFPDARSSKIHLDTFSKRMKRAFPDVGFIWKLEPQKRLAPHYHMLAWGFKPGDNLNWIPSAWYEIAGGGDEKHLHWHMGALGNQHCVQQVRTWEGVRSYASKYLGKTFQVEGWEAVGRYWGVINRSNIPFGELVVQEVTKAKALEVMRYQRRFAHLKGGGKKSSTIFCDADQWIEKLLDK